ncbi:transcriptional regulator [Alphaproteobacteria bacterium]|nr:transcriptional regulator [Alphaproteobacteria bacterium]
MHREAQGLTQLQLAELLCKSVETISNFERGKVVTSLYTLERLAHHLRVKVRDFFDEDEYPPVKPVSGSGQRLLNAIDLLSEDDLDVLADIAALLESRRRRQSSPESDAALTTGQVQQDINGE